MTKTPEPIDTNEAAKLIGWTPSTLKQKRHLALTLGAGSKNDVPPVWFKYGRNLFYNKEEVKKWLALKQKKEGKKHDKAK